MPVLPYYEINIPDLLSLVDDAPIIKSLLII